MDCFEISRTILLKLLYLLKVYNKFFLNTNEIMFKIYPLIKFMLLTVWLRPFV